MKRVTLAPRAIVLVLQLLPALSVAATLISAVANGVMMQGIANGSLQLLVAPSDKVEPFDRPGFLSWTAYNCFLLSWIPLAWCCRRYRHCSVYSFLRSTWAPLGRLRFMLAWSCGMQLLLLLLNMAWVVGLTHISVAMSNAIYQLQAIVTIGLSVLCLKSRFVAAEAFGMMLSLLGVAIMVVSPLMVAEEEGSTSEISSDNKDPRIGLLATLLSAFVWGLYQVAWRVISIGKRDLSSLEGLMDTFATLGVMGVVNLLPGWPLLCLLHWTGIETFVLPSWNLLPALIANGLVEYFFDTTCAIAIYLTSPVTTAITAPLTIPMSLVWDSFQQQQNGSSSVTDYIDWIGASLVLAGVVWMELKIGVPCCFATAGARFKRLVLPR
jgi:drug/metabolite transporter (DMT)-like permease